MDIVFVAVGLACFTLAVLYARGCDRVIGRDQASTAPGPEDQR